MAELQEQIFRDYIQFVENEKADGTYDVRHACILKYEQFCKDEDVDILDPDDNVFSDFVSWLRGLERDYSDPYFGRMKDTVSNFYEWARIECECDARPTKDFTWQNSIWEINPKKTQQKVFLSKHPEIPGKRAVRLYEEDIDQICEHVSPPSARNELLIRMMWQTAMRCDEITRVKKSSVDFDKRSIELVSAKADPGDRNYYRTVYYTRDLDSLLQKWFTEREASKYSDSPYLFISRKQEQMTKGRVSEIVKMAAKRAGLNEKMPNGHWMITGHTIRHASISYMANETPLKLNEIAKIAGHKSTDTTADYVQTPDEERRERVQRALREASRTEREAGASF